MPENFLSWVASIEGISVVGATRDTVIDARPARLLIAKLATLPATSTQNSAVYMLTFHDYGDGVLLAEISLGAALQFVQFDLPNGRRVIGAVTNDSAGTALLQSIRVA